MALNPGDLVRYRRQRLVRVLSVSPAGDVLLDSGAIAAAEDCGLCRVGSAEDVSAAGRELRRMGWAWPVIEREDYLDAPVTEESTQAVQLPPLPPPPAPPVKRPRGRPRKS